jgi:LmbE family N-acetylglucosaminyl deacetylase
MRAAKILGIKEVFFLGYRDSGMPGTVENNIRTRRSTIPSRKWRGALSNISETSSPILF